jgi:hypothetical protein
MAPLPLTHTHRTSVVDALGPNKRVAHQLAAAPEEGEELIVIKPPHAVRPSRLQPVGRLNVAHQLNVPVIFLLN